MKRRNDLFDFLRNKNIICQIHYIPAHLMPYYQDLGNKRGDYPIAEQYYDECLTLPIFPSLSIEDQEFVLKAIDNFFMHS